MLNPFKKDKKQKDLKEVLRAFDNLEKKVDGFSKELEILEKESKLFFQKMGVVRYNPFSEVGSNQSFSIALLDKNNDGVIITSLFGREGNRVYAKPVKNGNSEYALSDEEKKAVEEAMKNK
jgi:hypothetical protein